MSDKWSSLPPKFNLTGVLCAMLQEMKGLQMRLPGVLPIFCEYLRTLKLENAQLESAVMCLLKLEAKK